tara:strand:+ start:479 stop:1054 length:576 start_codon:yes stop_codon:yes gene_type:complete
MPKTTFMHGHIVDRMVFQAENSFDHWVVTVWDSHEKWKKGFVASQYHVSWPNKITMVQKTAKSATAAPKKLFIRVDKWMWTALSRLGRKWFDNKHRPKAVAHLVRGAVVKEVVRLRMKNPTLHATPDTSGKILRWVITDHLTAETYGAGNNELEAWEATAKAQKIRIPVEKSRPWRRPIKTKRVPVVNATQ